MSELTLDEAIKHCEEVAEQNETQADRIGRQFIGSAMDKCATDCRECASDHRQLAEWLMELKELRSLKTDYVFFKAEAKKLLKLAVEDLRLVRKCQCCKHQITGYADICCGCHVNTNKWEWRYAEEVLKLIGDEPNGI